MLAAALALLLLDFRSTRTGGGGGGSQAWTIDYTVRSPGWSTLGFVLAAVALTGGGTMLWLVRARRAVALGALLAIAGVGVLAWTIATPNDIRISPATYRSIAPGMPQAALTSRLGSPFTTDASASRRGTSIGCLVYQAAPSLGPSTHTFHSFAEMEAASTEVTGLAASYYFFCFDHGRLKVKSAI